MTLPVADILKEILSRSAELPQSARAELADVDIALITPRFRSSQYVIVVVVGRRTSRPIAVAKIPRLRGADVTVRREAHVLRALQASRPGGYSTIPRVLAVEQWADRSVLIQSALVGTLIDGHDVRRRPAVYAEEVLAWLYELPESTPRDPQTSREQYDRLVRKPLEELLHAFRTHGFGTATVEWTLDLLEPLRTARLPFMFEHGDLNYPNILKLEDGAIGVIDWELGEEQGFPGHDMFFFLAFVAFARTRARTRSQELAALHEAYLAPNAWGRRVAGSYADRLGIDRSLLTPLFVACWARHTASWLARRENAGPDSVTTSDADTSGTSDRATVAFIQEHLSFAFWKGSLDRLDDLRWE